ncbi:MAG: nitroreductase/quinone reductase family protein [Dermatophilaceae bacterium]
MWSRLSRWLSRRDAQRLRRMYAGGAGNATARRYARLWAWAFGKGLVGERWITLEVPGRTSGRPTRFPLGVTRVDGQDYLGAMLGDRCNWVRNVRANGGRAVIERRGRRAVQLVEIPPAQRAPLLKQFLDQVPGARPHLPVAHTSPVADFEPVAAAYPIFRVDPAPGD